MGLIKTLIYAVVIYYVWKVLVALFKGYSVFSELKKNHTQNTQHNPYSHTNTQSKPKMKPRQTDEGEYVDYEEIP